MKEFLKIYGNYLENANDTALSSARFIGAGNAAAGLGGAGVGLGLVFGLLLVAYAKNPQIKKELFAYALLGFALTEAMGLFALMMAFMILFI